VRIALASELGSAALPNVCISRVAVHCFGGGFGATGGGQYSSSQRSGCGWALDGGHGVLVAGYTACTGGFWMVVGVVVWRTATVGHCAGRRLRFWPGSSASTTLVHVGLGSHDYALVVRLPCHGH